MLNNADRVGLTLSEYIGQGDWRLFFLSRDRIRKAALEDVQKAAAAYLKPSNRTVGVFLPTPKPERAEIPKPVLAADAGRATSRATRRSRQASRSTPRPPTSSRARSDRRSRAG